MPAMTDEKMNAAMEQRRNRQENHRTILHRKR